jgi:hypothetical protein
MLQLRSRMKKQMRIISRTRIKAACAFNADALRGWPPIGPHAAAWPGQFVLEQTWYLPVSLYGQEAFSFTTEITRTPWRVRD